MEALGMVCCACTIHLSSQRLHFLVRLPRQTLGIDVVVAQVPVPDTTVMVELFLHDTAGMDLNKVRPMRKRLCYLHMAGLCMRAACTGSLRRDACNTHGQG